MQAIKVLNFLPSRTTFKGSDCSSSPIFYYMTPANRQDKCRDTLSTRKMREMEKNDNAYLKYFDNNK